MKASSSRRTDDASALSPQPPPVVVVDAQVVVVNHAEPTTRPSSTRKHRRRKQKWWNTQWSWILAVTIVLVAAIWLAQLEDDEDNAVVASKHRPKTRNTNIPPTLPPLIELTDTRSLEEIQKEYDNLELNIPYTANKDGGVQLHINRTELLKFLVARSRTKQKLQQALLAEEKEEDDDDGDGDSSLLDYYWGGTNEDDDYDDAISESPQLQSLTDNGDEL